MINGNLLYPYLLIQRWIIHLICKVINWCGKFYNSVCRLIEVRSIDISKLIYCDWMWIWQLNHICWQYAAFNYYNAFNFVFKRDLLLCDSIHFDSVWVLFRSKELCSKNAYILCNWMFVCQCGDSHIAYRLNGRGFLPSFVIFALMDFLVIPRLRRRIRDR